MRKEPLRHHVFGLAVMAGLFSCRASEPAGGVGESEADLHNETYVSFDVPCRFNGAIMMPGLRCFDLDVPADRAKPYDKTSNHVVLHGAWIGPLTPGCENDATDPVLYLSGGPGEALDFSLPLVELVRRSTGRTFVLLEQRGVGTSVPRLDCDSAAAGDPGKLRECHQQYQNRGVDLGAFNVLESAYDAEAVRKALHLPKWVLWGVSYGGRVAMEITRRFPTTVRAILLDSSDRPDSLPEQRQSQALDRALDRVFALCTENDACRSAYDGDVGLKGKLARIIKKLNAQPYAHRPDAVVDGQKFFEKIVAPYFDGLVTPVSQGMQEGFAVPPVHPYNLPWVIHEIDEELQTKASPDEWWALKSVVTEVTKIRSVNSDPPAFLQKLFAWLDRDPSPPGQAAPLPQNNLAMSFSVRCHIRRRLGPVPSVSFPSEYLENYYQNNHRFFEEVCADWPVSNPDERETAWSTVAPVTVPATVPVLLLNGEFDARVSPADAERLAVSIPNHRLVVLPGMTHLLVAQQDPCTRGFVNTFLRTLTFNLNYGCVDLMRAHRPFGRKLAPGLRSNVMGITRKSKPLE